MKFYGWRRAELAKWLKWVPEVEQMELFVDRRDQEGVDIREDVRYIDNEVSVSASEAEARVG